MSYARLDSWSRRAKEEGMPARSVFKLEEIDKRWSLFRTGDYVLDLGCAPGSWLLYASKQVGPTGRVIGVDLQKPMLSLPSHVEWNCADVFTWTPPHNTPSFHVVMSDMAPKTTGAHTTDALRSVALAERALGLALEYGTKDSHLIVKLLEGKGSETFIQSIREHYKTIERFRPKATRKHSTEIFIIGLGRVVNLRSLRSPDQVGSPNACQHR